MPEYRRNTNLIVTLVGRYLVGQRTSPLCC